jgi:hypothetical protein
MRGVNFGAYGFVTLMRGSPALTIKRFFLHRDAAHSGPEFPPRTFSCSLVEDGTQPCSP